MIRADFHLHTHYSFDTRTSLSQVIDRCLANNINCVAVTDHDTIEGALELQKIAPFKVIVGEEISSSEGHIIGLFLEEVIPHGLSARETIQEIHNQQGIAVAPHPFARIAGQSLGQAFIDNSFLFDAVEVANSNNIFRSDDARALAFAESNDLLKIAGSDSHLPCGIGSSIVEMADFDDPFSFLHSLETAKIYNKLHPLNYFIDMAWWTIQDMTSDALRLCPPVRGIRQPVVAR